MSKTIIAAFKLQDTLLCKKCWCHSFHFQAGQGSVSNFIFSQS
jgi:hypothetical protein